MVPTIVALTFGNKDFFCTYYCVKVNDRRVSNIIFYKIEVCSDTDWLLKIVVKFDHWRYTSWYCLKRKKNYQPQHDQFSNTWIVLLVYIGSINYFRKALGFYIIEKIKGYWSFVMTPSYSQNKSDRTNEISFYHHFPWTCCGNHLELVHW